ncbi:lipase family protein [Agaribacterium sp. ZY112]|uniref:lipase family protein n=1 Tax=Agaribacterium sp. ZY112 TaxID=3233574 RepID=UPI00352615CB
MTELSPEFAAGLASNIYDIKNEKTRKLFYFKYKNLLDLGDNASLSDKGLSGKTGGIVLKTSHMMGLYAEGLKDTIYQNQAIFAIKGTASLMDALTDLNAGIKASRTGGKVHQGFQDTFNTYADDIPTPSKNIHTIHCVGHSLGGALATLTADWLKSSTGRTVKLYTFGSPRVGLEFFSNKAKTRIGDNNLYRVHHKTDPVAMVPTWPFVHVPSSGRGDFLLPSNAQLAFWQPHLMANYIDSVEKRDSWDKLAGSRPQKMLDASIEAWLKSDGPLSFCLNTAEVAGAALLWVVEKAINLSGIAVVLGGSTIFTILDRLAYVVHKAADLVKEASFWVTRLIIRMATILGIKIVEGVNITYSFIRSIFIRMHHAVSELVRQAGRGLES